MSPIVRHFAIAVIAVLVFSAKINAQTLLDTAVDFTVKDIHGIEYNLFELLDSNKIVVIDFFSNTCGPCGTYAPEVQQSYLNWGSNSGNVFFTGISIDGDNADIAYFDSLHGITYPTSSGWQGGGNAVCNAYQIQSYPTVTIIRPDRFISAQEVWPPLTAKIDSAILAAGASPVGFKPETGNVENTIEVYPNPSNGNFLKISGKKFPKNTSLCIYTIDGVCKLQQSSVSGSGFLAGELGTLEDGTYLLIINRPGYVPFTSKVVILR